MEESIDSSNEETTLLVKCRRRHSQTTSKIRRGLLPESTNLSQNFKCKWQKIRFYLIEPMVLLLVFAYNLSDIVLKNRIMFQACTAVFAYNMTDCQQLSNRNNSEHIKAIEEEVQTYAARLFMVITLIQCIIPAIFSPFAGAWSDQFGRKPLLIVSFSGYFLFYFVTSLISHLSDLYNINPWYYVFAPLLLSFLGDSAIYSVATLSYISDVSTAKEKPYRMALYEALIYCGLMVGSFSSAILYQDNSSSTLIFSISALFVLFGLLIIIFVIPESLNVKISLVTYDDNTAYNIITVDERETKNVFNFRHVRDMCRTCFQQRQFEAHCVILLVISTLIICVFVVEGSISVFYLFIREKFQWTIKEYATFEGFSILIPILGNLLAIYMLRKIYQMKLLNLTIMGLLSHTCHCLIRGVAAVSWVLYLAILFGALKSIVNPMLRTVLSNLLPANEMGKIFSFISVLEGFVPLLASPLYTIVYSFTLPCYPGFFNVLSAILFILAIALLLIVQRKKQKYFSYYSAILN